MLAEQEAEGHAVVGGEEQVGKEPQPPHPQRRGSGQTGQTQAEKGDIQFDVEGVEREKRELQMLKTDTDTPESRSHLINLC